MVALLTLGTAVATFAGNVTVGRFYVELAKAKKVSAVDAVSAEAGLRQAGINLPKLSLDKGLTEGDMKSISASLGLTVKTEQPAAAISETQLSTFMSSFEPQLTAPKTGEVGTNQVSDLPSQSGRGKGKKKGHHKSSVEPF